MEPVKAQSGFRRELLLYLAIAGPGIVTALAGNGASGITTYSVVGSKYGLSMVWLLTVSTVGLVLFQEMSARMGAVTGKGLAALIRERFGLRPTFFAMLVLLITNVSITVAEFAGVTASLELFGVGYYKYLAVPAIAIFIWILVTRGTFHWIEKVFMLIALIQVCYIITGILAKPDWGQVAVSLVKPEFRLDVGYIYTAMAMVGTTIAPWMQFFVQGNVVDKGTTLDNYKYQRADVIAGTLAANLVALFIIITTAFTLYPRGVETAEQAALAFEPLAGANATWLFALGLFGASLLSATVVPLSTSYATCEAFGWESGIGRKPSQAPFFYTVYTLCIAIGVLVVLWPGISLVGLMLLAQELNGILLPIILVYMLIIARDRQIMGEHANGPVLNAVGWVIACGVSVMSLFLFITGLVSI